MAATRDESHTFDELDAHCELDLATIPEAPSPKGLDAKQSQVDRIIAIGREFELFHDGETAFAETPSHPDAGRYECLRVPSARWESVLKREYFARYGSGVGASTVRDATDTLQAQALYDGREKRVERRVARVDDDTVVIALHDEDARAVQVTSGGWHLEALCGDPAFLKAATAKALPVPDRKHATIGMLRRFFNVDDDDFVLLVAWLTFVLAARGPFVIVLLTGEQGSGKSTTANILQLLTDPATTALRSPPADDEELVTAAANGYTLTFDNVSSIPQKLSDTFCRTATGGVFAKRKLYSDTDEVVVDAMRPVVINSIGEVASRPDLLDRSIVIEHRPISGNTRRGHTDLWEDFRLAHPFVFAALLDGVSRGLRDAPEMVLDDPPRMADFARWGMAIAPAYDWSAADFLRAYRVNIATARQIGVEASDTASALVAFLEERGGWDWGNKGALFDALCEVVPESRRQWWRPQNAKGFGFELRRITPLLRAHGWIIENKGAQRQGSGFVIRIRREGQ